jgi:hypothetical protein
MKTFLKMFIDIVLAVALVIVGFAAGFPVGQSSGFTTGCEWAIMQANILAREAGLYMPVSFDDGQFRVVLKQPRNIYQRAWQLADKYDEEAQSMERNERLAIVAGDMKGE